eukprot:CAMPEP_0172014946 /NCGR_PEP_ID=MMETSP1041-20130122/10213_1 /TAXON_ID=464988 /ORGANISM="Hemiselmis andersenii, Strain CCMP439" /LENGTH=412 /DNA_ID=CAMNT_0012669765 /DNA_START=43 /DNA_END=1278 /DNA_ORIENTATION=+
MQPSLAIYTNEHFVERHGVIRLDKCFVNVGEDNTAAKGGPAYWIELDCRGGKEAKEFKFAASSRDEREEWVEALSWTVLNCDLNNGYDIDREENGQLGSGSYSTVWKAKSRSDGKVWAVKEMVKENVKYVEETNLREEIRIQKIVGQHPNIVNMKEFVETWDRYYIVLEHLDRGALLDRIEDAGKFTEHDALYIMMQLLAALDYLHDKQIVHRDLKPENFLLTDEPAHKCSAVGSTFAYRICIGDFGLASHCPEAEFLHALCGSPGYIAPEVIKEEPYGTAVDIWSLGVNLYILLTGIPPFAGNNDKESFDLTIKGQIKWSHLGECSATLRDLVSLMLKYQPSKRITAREALEHPWMKGEGVGDRQLHIKDNLRCGKELVSDAVSAGIRGVFGGFAALAKGGKKPAALPSTS